MRRKARQHPNGPPLSPEQLARYELTPDDLAAERPRHLIGMAVEDIFAVLYMRASTREQRGNLKRRMKALRTRAQESGIRVLREFLEICSGTGDPKDQPILREAIAAVRQFQRHSFDDTVGLLTDTRNRFVRGHTYDGRAETDAPAPWQLRSLLKVSFGVSLLTLIDPEADFGDVRAYETRVATAAGRKGGRPRVKGPGYKNRRREALRPEARALRERGYSLGEIARQLDVPKTTVARWVRR